MSGPQLSSGTLEDLSVLNRERSLRAHDQRFSLSDQRPPVSSCGVLRQCGSYDTFVHMKTTVDIPDALLMEARHAALREQTTVRALLIEGLRRLLSERQAGHFRLRRASFKGQGLAPDFADASWERIRDAAYQGRGG